MVDYNILFAGMGVAVAIVGLVVQLGWWRKAAPRIEIASPADGERLLNRSAPGEVLVRSVNGKVYGFAPSEIERLALWVELQVRTDRVYPQPQTGVLPDATWCVQNVYFGGLDNKLKATLKDREGRRLCEKENTVYVE